MKASLFVHKRFAIGDIDRNLFSGFVEHLGRCVYGGLYEPGHPTADADGFRGDVAELIRDLDMPLTRYPGGNFVSGFDWRDSIGPQEQRPVRNDYAWYAKEPNTFGLDEFVRWCRKAGTAPMYTVNLGTNTAKAAQEVVEYCNFDGHSEWSDLRAKNGSPKPYGIKYWCLGNEMDGDWQIGHKTAEEYGRIAHEAAKLMRWVDKDIKLIACGSSTRGVPTYGQWEQTVLRHVYNDIDFLSVHIYFGAMKDQAKFMKSPEEVDKLLEDTIAFCDAEKATRKSAKTLMVALDEWNVWRTPANSDGTEWSVGRPLLEDVYNMSDVLVDGGILLSLLNHADRVKLANIAQDVNVIAPIMTRTGGPAWKQTIYYPFYYTSKYARGVSLYQSLECPTFEAENEQVPFLKTSVVYNAEKNELVVFAINRSQDETVTLDVELGGFEPTAVVDAVEIHNDNPEAVNTETQETVAPKAIDAASYALKGATLTADIRAFSWQMYRIQLKG